MLDAVAWGPVLTAVAVIATLRLGVRFRPWRVLTRVMRHGS